MEGARASRLVHRTGHACNGCGVGWTLVEDAGRLRAVASLWPAEGPGGDELLEEELAGGVEGAGEEVQEREPGRRCAHVERSPMTASRRMAWRTGRRSCH